MRISISDIYVDDSFNSRSDFSHSSLRELMESIEKVGSLIEPVVVIPNPQDTPHRWMLIVGFRRFHSCILLKYEEVEATIREDITLEQAFMLNIDENLKRTDLTIKEEADLCRRLAEAGHAPRKICEIVGKSFTWVNQRLAFNNLPAETQEQVQLGLIRIDDVPMLSKLSHDKIRFKKEVYNILTIKGHRPRSRRAYTPSSIRRRNKSETLDLIHYLRNLLPNEEASFVCNILNWTIGNIDDGTLHATIGRKVENYKPPKEGIPSRGTDS